MGLFFSMGEEMSFKGAVQRKLHLAEIARERLFARVNEEVSLERYFGGIRFVAHRTHMCRWFCGGGVGKQMFSEVPLERKRLVAVLAEMRLHAGVNAGMGPHGADPCKLLVAHAARVGHFPRVGAKVGFEAR